MTTLHSIVSGHRIVRLNPGQLRLLQTVPPQQLLLLILRQYLVLRHELVLGNVHQEFGLLEMLNAEGVADLLHGLLGEGGDVHPQDEDGVRDPLLLHTVGVHLDRFDSDLFVLGKEHEQLIGFVVGFFHEDSQALPGGELSEPLRERRRGHIAHLPRDHVPALPQHGRDGLVHPEQAGGLRRETTPRVGGGRLGQDAPVGTGLLHFNVGHPSLLLEHVVRYRKKKQL
mmetsp:Transcript_16188/g.46507  ORF Transcript_16188/g.46507 Transcript_16188/m.46507 type:complete len:227 (-) Transcript_16188:69-749(-)